MHTVTHSINAVIAAFTDLAVAVALTRAIECELHTHTRQVTHVYGFRCDHFSFLWFIKFKSTHMYIFTWQIDIHTVHKAA